MTSGGPGPGPGPGPGAGSGSGYLLPQQYPLAVWRLSSYDCETMAEQVPSPLYYLAPIYLGPYLSLPQPRGAGAEPYLGPS